MAKIITGYEKQIKVLKLDLEKATKEASVEKKTAEAVCKSKVVVEQAKYHACTLDRERQRDIYKKALKSKKCPSPVWNYISFLGGAIVTGGVCALTSRVK